MSIMAHLVCGYPDMAGSYQIALALAAGGVGALELQFPFSDPVADGPIIQEACGAALAGGFRVADGLRMARRLAAETRLPIYIMSYASPLFAWGIGRFVAEAAGAAGIIAPDLPPESDEGLGEACRAHGIEAVAVTVAGAAPERIGLLLSLPITSVYVVLRRGITGKHTDIDQQAIATLQSLRAGGMRVFAGFGISQRTQVERLAPYADAVVVGSHFTRLLRDSLTRGDIAASCRAIESAAAELAG